jgi:hypothetical protein
MVTEGFYEVNEIMNVTDLIPDWQAASAAYQVQVDFFEHGWGITSALPVAALKEWIADYDSLIADYSLVL